MSSAADIKMLQIATPEQAEVLKKLMQFCSLDINGKLIVHVRSGKPVQVEYNSREELGVAKTR